MPASYTGIVPDTFKDGSEVVLKGHLEPDGFAVEPNGVMAKCPSKYDAPASRRFPGTRARPMPSLGSFLLLASFVVCAYAIAASVAGARRRSRRLIESGIGAFYLVAALMTVASGVMVHAFVTNDYAIKYVQHYSDSAQPLAYKIASYWGGLDGSIMFWVFLLGIFGAIAVYTNRERHRELIPYVVAAIAAVRDVLHLPDGRAQQPVLDVPRTGAGRREGAEPAPPELLHGDPSAVALHGLRRDDDPVRVRHGGADHRAPGRLVAARGAPLDDDRLAVPVVRPDARDAVGLRGARVGRLLGLGSGRERRRCCRGSRRPRSCTR